MSHQEKVRKCWRKESKLSEEFAGPGSRVQIFLATNDVQCMAFLGDTLNAGSGHLLGVTHFISGFVK